MNIPDTFQIPTKYQTNKFLFKKLTPEDAEKDYQAVISSIDIIHKTRGGNWPKEGLTLEKDFEDLKWHQNEFETKSSFAYAVYDPSGQNYLGCFYFYEAGFRQEVDTSYDVDVSFWVTQAAYDQGLYEELYKALRHFLQDWPFTKPFWSNKIVPHF